MQMYNPDTSDQLHDYWLERHHVRSGEQGRACTRMGKQVTRDPPTPRRGYGAGMDQRLGEFLLLHALRSALRQTKHIASYALVVHAKHDKAAAFYRRYGFQPIPGNPLHLFVPMSDIATLFANQAS